MAGHGADYLFMRGRFGWGQQAAFVSGCVAMWDSIWCGNWPDSMTGLEETALCNIEGLMCSGGDSERMVVGAWGGSQCSAGSRRLSQTPALRQPNRRPFEWTGLSQTIQIYRKSCS
jgi:hypothetical protein